MTGSLPGPDGGEGYDLDLTRQQPESEVIRGRSDRLHHRPCHLPWPAGFVSSSKDERVWTTLRPRLARPHHRHHGPLHRAQRPRVGSRLPHAPAMPTACPSSSRPDLAYEVTDGPITVYNTVAEIRGTTRPDEVVIVSAHLDSWNGPGSQGHDGQRDWFRRHARGGSHPDGGRTRSRIARSDSFSGPARSRACSARRAYVDTLSDELAGRRSQPCSSMTGEPTTRGAYSASSSDGGLPRRGNRARSMGSSTRRPTPRPIRRTPRRAC